MQIEQYGFPFASVNEDRKAGANDWAKYFSPLVTDGVFPAGTQMQVIATAGMTVRITAGAVWIGGVCRVNTPYYDITLDPADGVLNRITRIVARRNRTSRTIEWLAINGVPASSPAAPSLVRDADYYDLSIATITINAGITTITQAMITDTRLNSAVCGLVSSLIQPDTSGWFTQFQSAFEAAMNGNQAAWDAWASTAQANWNDWLSSIENALSENAAAQLAAHLVDNNNPHGVTKEQLGAASATVEVSITLDKNSWQNLSAPYTQSVSVPGVTANSKGEIGLSSSAIVEQRAACRRAIISVSGQGVDTVEFVADGSKPIVDLPITLFILG